MRKWLMAGFCFLFSILLPAAGRPDTGGIDHRIGEGERNIMELTRKYESALRRAQEIDSRMRGEDAGPAINDDEALLDLRYEAVLRRRREIDGMILGTGKTQSDGGPGAMVSEKVAVRPEKGMLRRYGEELEALLRKQRELRDQGLMIETEIQSFRSWVTSEKGLPGR